MWSDLCLRQNITHRYGKTKQWNLMEMGIAAAVFIGCHWNLLKSLPNDKILDLSKLKEVADDNFNFDENGRKLFKLVENTVGKGEIARYEQFLLFPQCFQKTCTADTLKPGLVWERVKSLPNDKI